MENSTEKQTSTTSSTFRRVSVIVALVLFTLATNVFLTRVVLEYTLADYQLQHHVLILVAPAVVQGAPDVTRTIQTDIARRMKGGRE